MAPGNRAVGSGPSRRSASFIPLVSTIRSRPAWPSAPRSARFAARLGASTRGSAPRAAPQSAREGDTPLGLAPEQEVDIAGRGLPLQALQAQPRAVDGVRVPPALEGVARPAAAAAPFPSTMPR